MRTITTKYAGECAECGNEIIEGAQAIYERHVGLFCSPGCVPKETEDIRAFKQAGANERADKYEEWAAKRREKAAALVAHNEIYTKDYAFNTQPGHIPERARVIAREDQAYEHVKVAKKFEAKAKALRHVRVAGDAKRKRKEADERMEPRREIVRSWIKSGMKVISLEFGHATVIKVNRKTATVEFGAAKFIHKADLAFLKPE